MNNNWLPSTIRIQNLYLCMCNLSANAFAFIRVVTLLILIILNVFTEAFFFFLVHICSCLKTWNRPGWSITSITLLSYWEGFTVCRRG